MRRATCLTTLVVSLAMTLGVASRVSAVTCPNAGPFCIDGTVTDSNNSGVSSGNPAPNSQAQKTVDPNGSSKELGPINGSATKIGVINTAVPPMLGFTNPNAQVDLNAVYTQTAKSTGGDLWYYFGWIRDSNSGSGFISVEFQHNQLEPACVYTGVDFTDATSSANLINNCNPWANRESGDFLILWDQSGNSTTIYKRVFDGTAFGAAIVIGSAVATFSSDGFRGELAIDLTTDVFTSGKCESFANIIPGTVTGNSDTADYKDTLFATFPPVTNCGTVTITKATDPSGLVGTFTYTLAAGTNDIFYTGGVDTDCSVSGSNTLNQCRGTLTTKSTSPYTDTDTISNLRENDSNWTLAEDAPGSTFALKSIDCTLGATTYHLFGAGQTTVSAFKVEAGQTTACTIVNAIVKTTPLESTTQVAYAQVKDSISLTGIQAGASDASTATATFKLYSDNTCTTQVFASTAITLTYANSGTTATAAMATSSAQTIVPGATYYWRVTYSGDAFNNGFTTACGSETVVASFTFVGQP